MEDDVASIFCLNGAWMRCQPHLSSLPGLTGMLLWLLPLVFSTVAAAVQVLHEPEEGQLIEEDLGDLHQEVFSTVLQSLALKLRESVLSAADGSDWA